MSKPRKNERNYLFYFETFFYISKWKDQFAKSYRCCEVEEVNKVKLYILQFLFERNVSCYIQQNNDFPACFCFYLFVFFFSCAFMRKVLADFSIKLPALLYVIRSFDPLGCNIYYLVKRKRAEHTLKYLKMSTSYFCNNWCDVPWPWYVSANFPWSCGMSRLVFN